MNLIYFIRLLLKNVLLIGSVGVMMAILVFLMTRNKPDTYSSEMVIYTGLATGLDIETGSESRFDLFMTNAKFDNLINLIKSRQTLEETAVRLMTQHLMLEKPDPRYCSRETWEALQSEVPREIRSLLIYQPLNLAEQGYEMGPQFRQNEPVKQTVEAEREASDSLPEYQDQEITTYETRMVADSIRKTKSSPLFYTVRAGDYPLNIAKKYGLTLEQLERLNPGGFPIHGGQKLRVGDREEVFYVDTLIEKQVPVTVTISVPVGSAGRDSLDHRSESLSGEASENQANQSISNRQDPYQQLDSISQNFNDIYDHALEKVEAFNASVRNLMKYKEQDETNYIYSTLQSSNPIYGIDKVSKVRATRVQSSDLVKLSFESNDPGVCQQTLYFIYEVFKTGYQNIKGAQTSMVSDYFRQQRDAAKARLDSLEEYNKQYRMSNRIINYNEQTKFIAEQNEVLDRDRYDEMGKLSAAKAALFTIESQMDEHQKSLVQRGEIMNLRQEIARLTKLISLEEIKQNPDIETLSRLKRDKQLSEDQMNEFMQSAFRTSRTTEGIQMGTVLEQWLLKVVEVEESAGRLSVKQEQKNDFMAKYDLFAPLGSELNKIEREIGLAEQEYLNQTHSLDLSLLKQKNSEQSNIKIIDEPYYPLKPNPSKTMFTVVAAFMAGLMLTAALLILLEFIDTSIKFPGRAEELTKLKLIGAYPKNPSKPNPRIDFQKISNRLTEMVTQKIKLEELQLSKGNNPVIIMLTSTRVAEGKTFAASAIVERLRNSRQKVLYIKPFERAAMDDYEEQYKHRQQEKVFWDCEYEIPDNFLSISNVNELLRNFTFVTRGFQYIFIELPALLTSDFPAKLVAGADMTLLVCRATRTWNKADDEVLDIYLKNARHPAFALLNGVQVDNLESIIGEIPRKRSWLRKFVKKVINLDFKFRKN